MKDLVAQYIEAYQTHRQIQVTLCESTMKLGDLEYKLLDQLGKDFQELPDEVLVTINGETHLISIDAEEGLIRSVSQPTVVSFD